MLEDFIVIDVVAWFVVSCASSFALVFMLSYCVAGLLRNALIQHGGQGIKPHFSEPLTVAKNET